ncbi:hypothetical protein C0J52_06134 [Blattella germanica]|nr:hypothetical protein C0J52_06134 [Blattella germanica]
MKFCLKLGKTATDTHGMLVYVYGVETVSKKCVFEWFKHFRNGKEGVDDEPLSGLLSKSITPDNIERVLQIILADSPDLAQTGFFLFPYHKLVLEG